jgi:hypothetical protein
LILARFAFVAAGLWEYGFAIFFAMAKFLLHLHNTERRVSDTQEIASGAYDDGTVTRLFYRGLRRKKMESQINTAWRSTGT